MNVNSISDLSNQYMRTVLGGSVEASRASTGTTHSSPFAQMLKNLQTLEQTNPSKYAKVTQQISAKLSNAAQSANQIGDVSLASRLNTLSSDFANASNTGQMPKATDMAALLNGGFIGSLNPSTMTKKV
jgi:hypothetical protein